MTHRRTTVRMALSAESDCDDSDDHKEQDGAAHPDQSAMICSACCIPSSRSNDSHPLVLGEPRAGVRASAGDDSYVVIVCIGRVEIGVRVSIRVSIGICIGICSAVEVEEVSTSGRGSRTSPGSRCFRFSRFSLLPGLGLRRRRLVIILFPLFFRRRFSRPTTDISGG